MKLSVIIPTRNRCADLRECLKSLFEMERPPDEVIVVDSMSTDDTPHVVAEFPVRYVRIKERSRVVAKNKGVQLARNEILGFLDDDTVVDRLWSYYILNSYQTRSVGAVTGRVLPYGETSSGYRSDIIGKVCSNGVVIGNFDVAPPNPIEVDTVVGCNMSFKRSVLLEIGGFDENYKGNCLREETDVSLRVKRAGFRVMYEPRALVWHKSRGEERIDHWWFYWYFRNHIYFCYKNLNPPEPKLIRFLHGVRIKASYFEKSRRKLKKTPLTPIAVALGIIDGLAVYGNKRTLASWLFERVRI